MVIQKNIQKVGDFSVMPAYKPQLTRVPIKPSRPPLYLVPPTVPEVPSTRISPLWIPVSMLLGVILGPGDRPQRQEVVDLPPLVEGPLSPEALRQKRQDLETELAWIEDERRRLMGNGDYHTAQRFNFRLQQLRAVLGSLPHSETTTTTSAHPVIQNNAASDEASASPADAPPSDASEDPTDLATLIKSILSTPEDSRPLDAVSKPHIPVLIEMAKAGPSHHDTEDIVGVLRLLARQRADLFSDAHLTDLMAATSVNTTLSWVFQSLVKGRPEWAAAIVDHLIAAARDNRDAAMIISELSKTKSDLFSGSHIPLLIELAKADNHYAGKALNHLGERRAKLFLESHIPGLIEAAKTNGRAGLTLLDLVRARPDIFAASHIPLLLESKEVYPFGQVLKLAAEKAAKRIEDIFTSRSFPNDRTFLWQDLRTVVLAHPDPIWRGRALENAALIPIFAAYKEPEERLEAMGKKISFGDEAEFMAFRQLVLAGLKDPDIDVVALAWHVSQTREAIDPQEITEDLFTKLAPSNNPSYNLAKFVPPLNATGICADILMKIALHTSVEETNIPLSSIRPIHSFAYDDSADELLKYATPETLRDDLEKLRKIIQKNPYLRPYEVLEEFTYHYSQSAAFARSLISVLQFPSGRRLLNDDPYRAVVLLSAVREGIIQANWLEYTPVRLLHYHGPVPESLIWHLLTQGYEPFTMDDLLPPR